MILAPSIKWLEPKAHFKSHPKDSQEDLKTVKIGIRIPNIEASCIKEEGAPRQIIKSSLKISWNRSTLVEKQQWPGQTSLAVTISAVANTTPKCKEAISSERAWTRSPQGSSAKETPTLQIWMLIRKIAPVANRMKMSHPNIYLLKQLQKIPSMSRTNRMIIVSCYLANLKRIGIMWFKQICKLPIGQIYL